MKNQKLFNSIVEHIKTKYNAQEIERKLLPQYIIHPRFSFTFENKNYVVRFGNISRFEIEVIIDLEINKAILSFLFYLETARVKKCGHDLIEMGFKKALEKLNNANNT